MLFLFLFFFFSFSLFFFSPQCVISYRPVQLENFSHLLWSNIINSYAWHKWLAQHFFLNLDPTARHVSKSVPLRFFCLCYYSSTFQPAFATCLGYSRFPVTKHVLQESASRSSFFWSSKMAPLSLPQRLSGHAYPSDSPSSTDHEDEALTYLSSWLLCFYLE